MLSRLRAADGFGIIELSVAMVMLNIGILAIVAAFSAAASSLRRSSLVANATVIADKEMESFRGMRNCQIYLDANTMPSSSSQYALDTGAYANVALNSGDTSYLGAFYNASTVDPHRYWVVSNEGTTWADSFKSGTSDVFVDPVTCAGTATTAHQASVTGPDARKYIVDTYVFVVKVSGGTWQKQVTIVVRDPNKPTGALARESSTFDPFDAP